MARTVDEGFTEPPANQPLDPTSPLIARDRESLSEYNGAC
jgi:hypothetical protein